MNYAREMEQQLAHIGTARPTLLLHCCCAPCSSAVLERLDGRFRLDALYWNPNISPETEYQVRLTELRRLAEEMPLTRTPDVFAPEYDAQVFFDAVRGLDAEPEGGKRCEICFRLRLEQTARLASAQGYEFFATTLTISPLKNAALLNEIGSDLAQKYGVSWLFSDFKKQDGYRRSVALSAEYGLYRQNYCGCVFSQNVRKPKTK